jgi:hypothetical protein
MNHYQLLLQKIYLFLKDPQMEGLDFNNVTFKSLIGFSNFTISRREMEIEIWFTSQMKGTHVVLTQTFFALLSME